MKVKKITTAVFITLLILLFFMLVFILLVEFTPLFDKQMVIMITEIPQQVLPCCECN